MLGRIAALMLISLPALATETNNGTVICPTKAALIDAAQYGDDPAKFSNALYDNHCSVIRPGTSVTKLDQDLNLVHIEVQTDHGPVRGWTIEDFLAN